MWQRSLRFLMAVLGMTGLLAGCESAPPRPSFSDIRFTDAPPIRLAAGGIDVASEFKSSFQLPHVEHLVSVPPARAMENWAHARLAAASGGARARFVIQDASVVEVELKKKEEGITGAL